MRNTLWIHLWSAQNTPLREILNLYFVEKNIYVNSHLKMERKKISPFTFFTSSSLNFPLFQPKSALRQLCRHDFGLYTPMWLPHIIMDWAFFFSWAGSPCNMCNYMLTEILNVAQCSLKYHKCYSSITKTVSVWRLWRNCPRRGWVTSSNLTLKSLHVNNSPFRTTLNSISISKQPVTDTKITLFLKFSILIERLITSFNFTSL